MFESRRRRLVSRQSLEERVAVVHLPASVVALLRARLRGVFPLPGHIYIHRC